jgi:hypothetical protein
MPKPSARPITLPPLDLSGLDYLLPDEDPATFTEFRDALLEELAPRSAYQKCVAMNLVGIEWDIGRNRRLLAAALRDAFRRHATSVAERELAGRAYLSSDAADGREDAYDEDYAEYYAELFASDLTDRKPKALAELAQTGVSRSEIAAAAQRNRATAVAYHEDRIAELERRRRALLADYETLKSRRLAADAIEDAVVVT